MVTNALLHYSMPVTLGALNELIPFCVLMFILLRKNVKEYAERKEPMQACAWNESSL